MKLKKVFLSTKMSKNAAHWVSLILRFTFGTIMIPHGWSKIQKFDQLSSEFISFMGLSPSISLSLVIFAELVCAILLIIGLFTRLATIPLIITAFVIMSSVKNFDVIGNNDIVLAMMGAFIAILILGPGKHSFDHMITM